MDSAEPLIPNFYAGKKVLITGATGFIGKVLVWKLLHSCSAIDTIYVLIRGKRGESEEQRLEEILNFPIFDNLRSTNPEIFQKVVPIRGDIGKKNLNLCESDRCKLQNEVSVVFHIAAFLKMDATLKQAINMNVEATLTLLDICTEMPNLKAFIYVSTAYCYCDRDTTGEKVYPAKDNPYDVMKLVQWMDPNLLASLTPRLIEPLPNTYTYSKRLAENVVLSFHPRLPVAIARPSIVLPSYKEPFPGWVDNLNGLVGIMMAVGKGVLRSVHSIPEYQADVLPVDTTCNALIAIAWKTAEDRRELHSDHLCDISRFPVIPVYNICAIENEPPTWKEVAEIGYKAYKESPMELVLWYPEITVNRYKILHVISTFLFQWVPAYFIDFILFLIGYEPFMIRVQKKITLGCTLLTYFSNRRWKFVTRNMLRLKESLSGVDEACFPVTVEEIIDRQLYMNQVMVFVRSFLANEDPSTLPASIRKLKILYVLHCVVKIISYILLFWFAFAIIRWIVISTGL